MNPNTSDSQYKNCAFLSVSVGVTKDNCSSESPSKQSQEAMDVTMAKVEEAANESKEPKPGTSKSVTFANDSAKAIAGATQDQSADDKVAIACGAKPASSITVQLEKPLSWDFSHVIVYLPAIELSDGSMTTMKGVFKVYTFGDLALEFPLTDFEMERGMYKNRWRTLVKPVNVLCKAKKYVEASLFCRVRVGAQMELVFAIAGRLTRQLDVYKDHIRDGIAQEWCAQEQWRIFPRFPGMQHEIKRIGDGRPDMRKIMKELLPEGFDNEWPM